MCHGFPKILVGGKVQDSVENDMVTFRVSVTLSEQVLGRAGH